MLGQESETLPMNQTPKLIKKSEPISIPKNPSLQNLFDENDNNSYKNNPGLTGNFFNPQKFSPPDIWKNRLQDRIRKHLGSDVITIHCNK